VDFHLLSATSSSSSLSLSTICSYAALVQAGADDAKLIGVYSSPSRAEAAAKRLRQAPGFCDHPDGFTIDPYPVDEDHWREGFGSYRPGAAIGDQ
jgi:hypothetical protein